MLESYTRTALRRVWRAQWFSFWMTSMLHRFSDASDFDLRRQIAELELVTSSPTAAKTLADNYTVCRSADLAPQHDGHGAPCPVSMGRSSSARDVPGAARQVHRTRTAAAVAAG